MQKAACAVLVACCSYRLVALLHQLAPIHACGRVKAGRGPRVRARHTTTLSRVAITQEPRSRCDSLWCTTPARNLDDNSMAHIYQATMRAMK